MNQDSHLATYERTYIPAVVFGALLAAKPAIDAAFEGGAIRLVYLFLMFVMWFTWQFEYAKSERNAPPRSVLVSCISFALYFWVTASLDTYSNAPASDVLAEAVKISSPFLLLLAILSFPKSIIAQAIYLSAALNLGINFIMLFSDSAWIVWGQANTFKGIYYFKTDLAYAINMSLLALVTARRFRIDLFVLSCIAASGIMVFLANSRMNYAMFAIVCMFIFVASRRGSIGVCLGLLALMTAGYISIDFFQNQSDLLGFDTTDNEAFTQGRNVIWEVLVSDGLAQSTIITWIFGSGYFGDVIFWMSRMPFADIFNAHNEFLHVLFNFGVVGLVLWGACWASAVRCVVISADRLGKISVVAAGICYLLQASSTVMLGFTTKTWPAIYLLSLVWAMPARSKDSVEG